MYVFLGEGLMSYDLKADQAHWLLDNAAFVQPFEMGSGYVLFSYTDRTDRKSYTRCLNLSTAHMETIPVESSLHILELAFNNYPQGFLQQLPFGALSQIRIELVTNLRGQDEMNTHPESVGGFAQNQFDHYLIVFDGLSLDTQTVYHEFSHVIDKHLEWDASLRPQALFSEETWLSLQPAGFRYADSYTDMPDAIAAYENSGYFISRYAMTFPTEDRATLMAAIISDKTILQENPAMAEKMRYYAACIRDCFDTTTWSEKTLWEYTPKS